MSDNVIEVKVIQVPGAVKDIALREGATVNDALKTAGVEVQEGYAVKLDGSSTGMDTTVSDGSRLIIAKEAKGNK